MDLRDLYQEVILDHSRNPRNFHELDEANHDAEGFNPICGDRVKIFAQTEDGLIKGLSFQGAGCAISTASASILTEVLAGKSVEEAQEIAGSFYSMVTGTDDEPDLDALGKLAAFSGVCEYPNRVKCATLAWHTLRAALENRADTDTVSTEDSEGDTP